MPENCVPRNSKNRQSDIQALGEKVMVELMDKDPSRWPKDAAEFQGLTMTKSTKELAKVGSIQV
jgi:hypothetical protein